MTNSSNKKTYRVLLIEDDPLDAKIIKRKLYSSPGSITDFQWTTTGDKAIEITKKSEFDIILLDYYLGRETALEFIQRMPIHVSRCAIVILTGKDESEADDKSFELGVESFLCKNDLDSKLLLRTMRYAARNKELQNRLTDFADILAHDLNGLASNITSVLDLLDSTIETASKSDIDDLIGRAKSESIRLSSTLQSLHDFCESKSGNLRIEETDLSQTLSDALANISSEMKERGVRINKPDLPHWHADQALLVHLFKNLIQNAIKYNSNANPVVNIESRQLENELEISISDNGIGIARTDLKRIFRPLERVNRDKNMNGSGLGLAICKEIAERHGGKLWAESEGEGKGTTFYFQLPTNLQSLEAVQ